MHVQFKVHGSGKKNLHGDGIAIWYAKDRLHAGNVRLISSDVSTISGLSDSCTVLFDAVCTY